MQTVKAKRHTADNDNNTNRSSSNTKHSNHKDSNEMCNGCNSILLSNHGDRILSLKSHRETLEQESGFSGVLCD